MPRTMDSNDNATAQPAHRECLVDDQDSHA